MTSRGSGGVSFLGLLAAALVSGCGAPGASSKEPVTAENTAPVASALATATPSIGAPESANNGKESGPVWALAKTTESCEWRKDVGFYNDCPGRGQWNQERALFDHEKNSNVLVDMLESKTPRLEYLAANKLRDARRYGSADFGKDAKLADRILKVAEGPVPEPVAEDLGYVVSDIDLEATKLDDRVFAIMRKHPQQQLRLAVIRGISLSNLSYRPLGSVWTELLGDPDPEVRKAVVQAVGPIDTAIECPIIVRALGDADEAVLNSVYGVTFGNKCSELYPDVVTRIEKSIKQGTIQSNYAASSLRSLCEDDVDAPLKKRVIAAAKELTADKYGSNRASALEALGVCGEKAFVKKFVNDKDDSVKQAAKAALEAKP